MASITVRGYGIVTAPPDEVVVQVTTSFTAESPAEAFTEATARAVALDALLDELQIDRGVRATTGIIVHEVERYDEQGTQTHKHRAANSVTLRLESAEIVPALLRSAVERAHARVNGPWWRLRDRTAASSSACRLAIADATRRAEAYAGELGLRVGDVEIVQDAEVGQHAGGGATFGALMADEPMPVHPGQISVSAVVDVTFALESP